MGVTIRQNHVPICSPPLSYLMALLGTFCHDIHVNHAV
jgi:hypothetical protein